HFRVGKVDPVAVPPIEVFLSTTLAEHRLIQPLVERHVLRPGGKDLGLHDEVAPVCNLIRQQFTRPLQATPVNRTNAAQAPIEPQVTLPPEVIALVTVETEPTLIAHPRLPYLHHL